MATETDLVMQSLIDNGLMNAPTPTEPSPAEPPATEPLTPLAIEPPAVVPPIEPPVLETPPTAPPIEPAPINELEIINRHLGANYTTLEDAKNDFTELPTLRELKNQPMVKFANESFAELNSFALATGINESGVFKDLKRYTNTEQKDPIEAMVLAEIIAEPFLSDRKDMVRKQIQMKYNTTVDADLEDQNAESQRVELEKFRMERDAITANKLISETMGKVTSYKETAEPDNTKAIQEQKAVNQSAWNTVLADNNFTNLLNSIEVEVPLGKQDDDIDLGTETVKYELTAEQKQSAIANIKGMVEQGFPCTQENMNAALEVEQLKAMKENMPSLLSASAKQFLSKQKEILEAKYHNKSTPPKIETPTPLISEKGKIDDVSQWALANMNQMS